MDAPPYNSSPQALGIGAASFASFIQSFGCGNGNVAWADF